jgi:single stranded DNA-binding protein
MPATKEKKAEAGEPQTREDKKLPREVTRVGNLTRDPELRFGQQKGTPFCRFGLAVETPVTPGDWAGERRTEFYEVSCFNTLAEHVAELTKGARVIVKGRPELDHWQDSEGKDRVTKRLVADAVGAELRFTSVEIIRAKRAKSSASQTSYKTPDGEESF